MKFTSAKDIMTAINQYSDYKVMWRSGFAFKGANEREVERKTQEVPCHPYFDQHGKWSCKKVMTFEEQMKAKFNWAAAMKMTIDHDSRVIHINGYSESDMY